MTSPALAKMQSELLHELKECSRHAIGIYQEQLGKLHGQMLRKEEVRQEEEEEKKKTKKVHCDTDRRRWCRKSGRKRAHHEAVIDVDVKR